VPPWNVCSADPSSVARLSTALGVRRVTACCLLARGLDDESAARAFLSPRLAELRPPVGLAGLERATERLVRAVTGGEHIGCFGDYDVDGVTTAALFATFLGELGAQVSPRVARRHAGYGFGEADARWFADQGCNLVVTGDCGTSDIAAVALARELGTDTIVVDHHTVPPAGDRAAHPALALVNPLRDDSTFPFRGMASVGLMFYMMVALRTRLRADGWFKSHREPDVRELLDLVALGTVADMVPLCGENRILVTHGMSQLARRARPGIDAILRAAAVDADRPIDEKTISWKLAPRLNAPGRLGDAAPALELLLSRDGRAAAGWAEALERANEERRDAQGRVLDEVLANLDGADPGPAVVVWGRGWPSGVVGIVAAKLVERYQRPAFVIAIDPQTGEGRGSARSCGGVNLYRALAACEHLLVRFGGHAGAAGLTVDEARTGELAEALGHAVSTQEVPVPSGAASVDAEVALGEVDGRLADELARLGPFGQGNAAPVLAGRGLRVRASRRVGDGSHLKLELEDHTGAWRPGIGFGLGAADPGPGAHVDAAFVPVISHWQGQRRVELEVRELVPTDDPG